MKHTTNNIVELSMDDIREAIGDYVAERMDAERMPSNKDLALVFTDESKDGAPAKIRSPLNIQIYWNAEEEII